MPITGLTGKPVRIRRGPATVREGAASHATRQQQPGKAKRLAAIAATFRVRRPAQIHRRSAFCGEQKVSPGSSRRSNGLLTRISPRRTSLSDVCRPRSRRHRSWRMDPLVSVVFEFPRNVLTTVAFALMVLALGCGRTGAESDYGDGRRPRYLWRCRCRCRRRSAGWRSGDCEGENGRRRRIHAHRPGTDTIRASDATRRICR